MKQLKIYARLDACIAACESLLKEMYAMRAIENHIDAETAENQTDGTDHPFHFPNYVDRAVSAPQRLALFHLAHRHRLFHHQLRRQLFHVQ